MYCLTALVCIWTKFATILKKYIGKIDSVFHEILSEYVHIDVHWIKPTPETPYNVLFTTGMSDYPMYLPEGLDDPNDYSHAELMVYLPANWPISDEAFKDDDNYWPVYFLKMIARFPHQYKTWMAEGHTIPNGPDAEPIANTDSLYPADAPLLIGTTRLLKVTHQRWYDYQFLLYFAYLSRRNGFKIRRRG